MGLQRLKTLKSKILSCVSFYHALIFNLYFNHYIMQRRTFLKTAFASSAMLAAAPFEQFANPATKLHAQETYLNIVPNAPDTKVWSFQQNAFSPPIIAEQGEELSIWVENDVDQSMTVHWHGVRVSK